MTSRRKASQPDIQHARHRGCTAVAGVFFLLALALALYYIAVPAQAEFHSDCTDTILWALASAESGRWLSDTFVYACFLPFGGQLLMLPFYGLFGYTITTHMLGMCLFTLLLAAAALGLFRAMRWSWAKSLASAGALLLLFLSSAKSREMFYNHIIYYSLSVLFLFALEALALRLDTARARFGRVACLAGSLILAFMAAANGLSQLALCLAPLLAAIVLTRFIEERGFKGYFRKNGGFFRDLPLIAVLIVGVICGLVFRRLLTSGLNASYEAEVSGFVSPDMWRGQALLLPHGWRSLFDFDQFLGLPAWLQRGFEWACTAALPLFYLVTLPVYRHMTRAERLVTMTSWMLTAVSVLAWVFTGMGGAGWRLIPCAAGMLVASAITLKYLFKRLKRPRLAAVIAAALVGVYIGASVLTLSTDARSNAALRSAEFLAENGLNKGYATFWHAQAETLLSGGKVSIQPVMLSAGGVNPLDFQSDPAWYPSAKGETVFLMVSTEGELPALSKELTGRAAKTLTNENMTILVYNEPLFE